jgi:hypothetical protein
MTANKRTYEVDRILTRELCLKYPDNTPPLANLAVLTDGRGGTYYGAINLSTNATARSFNEIYLPDTKSTVYADLSYNILNFKTGPGMYVSKLDRNTLIFQTTSPIPSSYYRISTPTGTAYADNISSYLTVIPEYGAYASIKNNNLHIGAYPSFTAINILNPDGTSTINASTNISTLQLTPGFGVKLNLLNSNTLQIASNFESYALNQIQLPAQTINFTNNFNSVKFEPRGNLTINTNPLSSSTVLFESQSFAYISTATGNIYPDSTNYSLNMLAGPGISLQKGGTNEIYINLSTSAFTAFNIYSTATAYNTDLSNFPYTSLNTTAGGTTAIGLAGVNPIQVQANTNPSTSQFYVGLNYPFLFSGIVSSISTTKLYCPNINISTLTILDSLAFSSSSDRSTMLTVNNVSTSFINATISAFSTIAASPSSVPLVQFDYTYNRVSIAAGVSTTNLSLVVSGIILADNHLTFSDSSLKNFTGEFKFTQADLEILKPWKFTWKATNSEDMGFAAEDVEKVAPYAVKYGPTGLRMVDYARLSVVSMAALRETNKRLVAVESTVASLLTKIV